MEKLTFDEVRNQARIFGLNDLGTNQQILIRVLDYVQEYNLNENEIYQSIIVNPLEPAKSPASDVHLMYSHIFDLAGGAVALDNFNKTDLKPSDSVSQVSNKNKSSILERRTKEAAKAAGLAARINKMKELYALEDDHMKVREQERILVKKRPNFD